jgi:hypothetical protein
MQDNLRMLIYFQMKMTPLTTIFSMEYYAFRRLGFAHQSLVWTDFQVACLLGYLTALK